MERVTQSGVGPEFLRSEANGGRSREAITLVNAGGTDLTVRAGTVLAEINIGALTAESTAFAGNTGNGAMGAVTVDVGAQAGTWKVLMVEPGSNVGNFVVERPDGTIDGQGDVAAAYNGGINFTLADGATDFVAGDGFDIVVSEASATNEGKYVIHDPEGTTGTQNARAILYDTVVVPAAGTAEATGILRDAEYVPARLTWDDHSSPEKTAAMAQLAEYGLIARP